MARLAEPSADSSDVAAAISRMVQDKGYSVAAAESLTSGNISCCLGAAEASSSSWFAGSVIAYSEEVKYVTLGVDRGPVVTASCALQMASGVARLLGTDFAVAVTGAGGPEPKDEQPVGTVYTAVWSIHHQRVERSLFDGKPDQVVHGATLNALRLLAAEIGKLDS